MDFLPRLLFSVLLLCVIASAQTPTLSVSAGKSKEQQQKQAEFDVRYANAVALRRARDFQAALDKFQEAEQLAGNLTDTKYSWLQEILAGEADCLIALKKFPEAETVLLRRRDALRISTNELDNSYAHNFSVLADLSAKRQDWSGAEQYLQLALKAHDKLIAHFAGSGSNAAMIQEERRAKALDMFHMGLAYAHEGKYAEALVVLNESFTTASEAHAPSQQLTPIATAARDIAVHTGFPADVEKWHGRLTALSDGAAASKK